VPDTCTTGELSLLTLGMAGIFIRSVIEQGCYQYCHSERAGI